MRRWIRRIVIVAVAAAALGTAAFFVARSEWFAGVVREKIVETAARASGARVEIGRFSFDGSRLRARLDRVALHGTEPATVSPLFQADALEIDFKLVSMWRRDLDVEDILVERPRIHLIVDANGNTNLPKPAVPASGGPVADLLKMAAGKIEVREGEIAWNDLRVPLTLRATSVRAALVYEKKTPRYRTSLAAEKLDVNEIRDIGLSADLTLEANRIGLDRVELRRNGASLQAKGELRNLAAPRLEADFEAALGASEIPSRPLAAGQIAGRGHVSLTEAGYRVEGAAAGTGIGVAARNLRLTGARVETRFRLTPEGLDLTRLSVGALGGTFLGAGSLRDWRRFDIKGELKDLDLARLQSATGGAAAAWNGTLSGPVVMRGEVTTAGLREAVVQSVTSVHPAEGQMPLEGEVSWEWRQRGAVLTLGESNLRAPHSSLRFSGAPGDRIAVNLATTDLAELMPVVSMASGRTAPELPVRLRKDGEARFIGTVSGQLSRPEIAGRLSFSNAVVRDSVFESGDAEVTAAPEGLELRRLSVARGAARMTGTLRLGWTQWEANKDSRIAAALLFRNVDTVWLQTLAGRNIGLTGELSGTASVNGDLSDPEADVQLVLKRAEILGEQFERASTKLHYHRGSEGFRGTLDLDDAALNFSGKYDHAPGVWDSGSLRIDAEAKGIELASLETVQKLRHGLGGSLQFQGAATLRIAEGKASLRSVDAKAAVAGIMMEKERFGALTIDAKTQGAVANVSAEWSLRDEKIKGDAQVQLAGNYPARGKLAATRLPLDLIRDLAAFGAAGEPWPFRGSVEGEASFEGPLLDPRKGVAQVTLTQLRLLPREALALESGLTAQDLAVRNAGPLVLDLDGQGVRVRQAEFAAKNSDIKVSGSYSFVEKLPWNVRVIGGIDLAVISTFKPELQASGASTVNVSIRGAANNPQINGRMEVKDASLMYQDIPNTLAATSGVVVFDQNRVNIERLTGKTGGGVFSITGFMTLGRQETIYRLQGQLKTVRVRYPEGVSTQLDADLSLTGTSARSLLAGTVNVVRAGFSPRTDLASAFAETRPSSSLAPGNPFLQGIQFDVRIRTASNAQFVSEYTQELQTEADLRLRGSLAKPILLGAIKANQGQITFFGNRYLISRGEVLFYNTAAIQPALDLDLETRVRGITVYLNVSGPTSKLNINYRSDPPLQSQEIVALLTVGRTPTGTGLTGSGDIRRANVLEQSPNSLLGGALSASVTNRLNRLFGVSRVRIDPQMTGVENIPQARLTVEQQVSRDVTLTFITNLNRTAQEIVQVQWDLNRQWSMIAVRDENGLFGVDFLFRKRFK